MATEYKFKRVGRPYKTRYWSGISFLVILFLIILIPVLGVEKLGSSFVYAQDLEKIYTPMVVNTKLLSEKVSKQQSDNELLKEKLAASSKVVVDKQTKDVVILYLKKYFGNDWEKAEKVFTCESGLSPLATHKNSDAAQSADYGVAQLNDVWQGARFEAITGYDIHSVASADIEMNLRVAAAIYKESGFNQWVCRAVLD